MDNLIKTILKDKETILITGSNGVGKSFLAYELMKAEKYFYYIGVVNQSFKLRDVPDSEDFTFKFITEERLITEDKYESKAYDTYGDNGTSVVAKVLGKKFLELLDDKEIGEQFKKILKEFNINLTKDKKYVLEIEETKFQMDDGKDISIGYQTILRLFTELFLLKKKDNNNFIIFLDEISKSLDCINSLKLIKNLEIYFPNYKFIITTHSYDLILGANNSKIVKITSRTVHQYFESNDYKSIDDIRKEIFLLNDDQTELDHIEKILYRIGNLIDNLRKNKQKESYDRLKNLLNEIEGDLETSNKIKVMWEYAHQVLEAHK